MKNLFISLPMRGRSDEDILEERGKIASTVGLWLEDDINVLGNFINNDAPVGLSDDAQGVWYLGESIKLMSEADIVAFSPNWKAARGCRIEKMVAEAYGLRCFFLTLSNYSEE